jgi:hypothetical protein
MRLAQRKAQAPDRNAAIGRARGYCSFAITFHDPGRCIEHQPFRERYKLKTQGSRALLLFSVAALAASPVAMSSVRSVTGSSTTHSGSTFYVSDTKADGHSAYGNWGGTTNNRLQNNSGSGTTVSRSGLTIGSHRACVDQFGGDPCSIWGS